MIKDNTFCGKKIKNRVRKIRNAKFRRRKWILNYGKKQVT